MSHTETPLEAIVGLPSTAIQRLRARWIASAEQLVSLGASANGIRGLAQELNVDESEAKRIVGLARGILSPAAAAEAERVVDTSRYPLGVDPPSPDRDSPAD